MSWSNAVLFSGLIMALGACSSKPTPDELASAKASAEAARAQAAAKTKAAIDALCEKMDRSIARYHWNLKTCEGIAWQSDRVSEEGRPLIYAEFGDLASPNKTLILGMVHPDEITPLYLGFKLAHYFISHESEFRDAHIILAPLVNPDGFFRKPRTRMNANGVDVNRNFDTPLWRAKALKEWRTRLHKNPRRYPGSAPSSEAETKFQVALIERFHPTKVLSMHAPLNVMDYDGPTSLTLDRFAREYVHECYQLRNRLRAKSTGYFPGSLGNYSGVERGIPTVTLELPSANPRLAEAYWKKFRPGIHSMVDFKFDSTVKKLVDDPKPRKK
jgi:protein MpaA